MNDERSLINRIDQEVAAEVKRQKDAWTDVMAANRDRELRLQRYEAEAQRIIDYLKTRLDAFVDRFKAMVNVEPTVRQHTRGVNLIFAATVARASLRFEVFPDQSVDHIRLECIQEIVPVVVPCDKQSVRDYPLDGVMDDEVVQWFDDRIIVFVKTYLAIVRQDAALREQLKGQLVEDPVTKILFPKALASSTLQRAGVTYYFVDEDSRRQFEQQPVAVEGAGPLHVVSKA